MSRVQDVIVKPSTFHVTLADWGLVTVHCHPSHEWRKGMKPDAVHDYAARSRDFSFRFP